ncbi:uncharacterized protein METZ01_LOCUS82649 [marine metagenome]|uniref:Uncharacterized protein n=1 Tax=marine metagenome TaxID=408172 RepID=A0A381UNQ5_9ZZZZ
MIYWNYLAKYGSYFVKILEATRDIIAYHV